LCGQNNYGAILTLSISVKAKCVVKKGRIRNIVVSLSSTKPLSPHLYRTTRLGEFARDSDWQGSVSNSFNRLISEKIDHGCHLWYRIATLSWPSENKLREEGGAISSFFVINWFFHWVKSEKPKKGLSTSRMDS
jgi:hypothetical protein